MTCHKVANPPKAEQGCTKINLILLNILVNFLMSEANNLGVLYDLVAVNFATEGRKFS